MPFSTLLLLTVGPWLSDQLHALSPHPAQFGCACFAAIFSIAILESPVGTKKRTFVIWMAAGIVAIAIASVFRQAIGLMGTVTGLLFAAVYTFRLGPRNNLAFGLIVAIALLASYKAPYLILRARDIAFQLPPSTMLEQHGIWHNLYIGLGVVPNPFGIEWSDDYARSAVNRADPSVILLSPRYFDMLRNWYFSILFHHPLEVAAVYLKKLSITLNSELPSNLRLIPLWMVTLVTVTIAVATRYLSSKKKWLSSDGVISVSCVYITLFIGQAMLFHYSIQYLFPIQLFILLAFGASLDMMLIAIRTRHRSRISEDWQ
jgi:hypothetical protein